MDMKKHHMIQNIQDNLIYNSIKDKHSIVQLDYGCEINTVGIIQFINEDQDIIKYFVLCGSEWVEHQNNILNYFDKSVGVYDRELIINVLKSHGYDDRNSRFIKLYAVYPTIASIIFGTIIVFGNGLNLPAFMLTTILIYLFIILFTIAYVWFYEKKGEVTI